MYLINFGIALFLAISLSSTVLALPSDIKKKIYIVADSTVYHYKKGIKIFTGHVKVDQGTTHLTADKVITKDNRQHQIEEITALGFDQQAHFWTLGKEGEKEIHALAKMIKYNPLIANVSLEENVQVEQGENNFKGQLIHYNMDDQTITVPASKNARAELVYTPDS